MDFFQTAFREVKHAQRFSLDVVRFTKPETILVVNLTLLWK